MALETTEWKIQDSLQDADSIFYYAEAVLDEPADAAYYEHVKQVIVEVRGGVERLAEEAGMPVELLNGPMDEGLLRRVMEAFRPESEKVAVRVA